MDELIYGSGEIQTIIKKKFPDAAFEDASDEIHPERFEVTFAEHSEEFEDKFYVFAIKEGFAPCCLGFRLLLKHPYPTEKHIARIEKICEKAILTKTAMKNKALYHRSL